MEFTELYQKFKPVIAAISYNNSVTSRIPKEDFISELNEALWNALESYDPAKGCTIETWSTRLLQQAAVRLIKSRHGTYYRRVYATLDKPADDDTPMSEPQAAETTEAAVFDRPNAKRAHQLELIRSLVGNADSPTISLVEAFLAAPLDARPTQIAKSVGLHHKVANDKLRKLSRSYDANRFGGLYDNLAV